MTIEIEIWHLVLAVLSVGVMSYLGVFLGLATLKWKDAASKRAIANVFMQEVGERIQTEQQFKDIVQNFGMQERKTDDED